MFVCLTMISQLSICYDTLDAKDLFLSDLTISFGTSGVIMCVLFLQDKIIHTCTSVTF